MKTMVMVAALALCACASDPHEEMRADANRMDSLAHELAQEAQEYCAAAPWASLGTCTEAVASHRELVGARLEPLTQMADRMDRHLQDVGSGALADSACGLRSLQVEMDRHQGASCGPEAATAEAEALGHCTAMMAAAAQLHARANAVLRATGHQMVVGGSGSMPPRTQRQPTGEHAWPWAAGEEPAGAAMCGP